MPVNRLPTSPSEPPAEFSVLGVRVNAVQIDDSVHRLERWIAERGRPRFVAVTGMHGVMEAQRDPEFAEILSSAGLVVPDGMPLVWLGRRRGFELRRRVYGPELMETFLTRTGDRYRHFLYGGSPDVVARLSEVMKNRFGSRVVGAYSPPFRPLTPTEEDEVVEMINGSGADVVWVGLSTPKQERWMHRLTDRLEPPALLGVGAAYDFIAGTKRSAPSWMQENGLEWLFRLLTEPRRLWYRYVVHGSQFVYRVAMEEMFGRARSGERTSHSEASPAEQAAR